MQSIILLYIKETDGQPADGAIQSRIGWEEIDAITDYPLSIAVYTECNKIRTILAEISVQLDVLIRLVVRSGK